MSEEETELKDTKKQPVSLEKRVEGISTTTFITLVIVAMMFGYVVSRPRSTLFETKISAKIERLQNDVNENKSILLRLEDKMK